MLSKPLAPQSVRTHRPSFWQYERAVWSPIVSALWPEKERKKKLCICCCWQIKWLRFWFFQWSGTFPLSSTHFLSEVQCLRRRFWQPILVWAEGAVIIILTVPEHSRRAMVDTKYRAAPGVRTKLVCIDTHTHSREKENAYIWWYICSIYTHECFISLAPTPRGKRVSSVLLRGETPLWGQRVHSNELVL